MAAQTVYVSMEAQAQADKIAARLGRQQIHARLWQRRQRAAERKLLNLLAQAGDNQDVLSAVSEFRNRADWAEITDEQVTDYLLNLAR